MQHGTSSDPDRHQHLLGPVIDIASQASQTILAIYDTDFDVQNKNDNSPLTAADMASHRTICKHLQNLTPDIPVLSEESRDLDFAKRSAWRIFWLVDPLDGTREFVKRNGEFTVNIALIDNHRPVLGVIHVPVTGICYAASQGNGAIRIMPGQPPQPIHSRQTDGSRLVVAGSRSHSNDRQTRFLASLGEQTEIISIGSSLKFCLVAEGKVDLYARFGPTSEWDTAAAQCIVEEAGGRVTDFSFMTLNYNTRESIINPDFLVIADKAFDWKPFLGAV